LTWVRGASSSSNNEWFLVDTHLDTNNDNNGALTATASAIGETGATKPQQQESVPVVLIEADSSQAPTTTPAVSTVTASIVSDSKVSAATGPEQQSLPQATLVTELQQQETNSRVVNSVAPVAAAATVPTKLEDPTVRKQEEEEESTEFHPHHGQFQVDYTTHVILPHVDTLAGLCLQYKISKRELQRVNHFGGDNLRLAPSTLIIPITQKAKQVGWQPQNVHSRDFQRAALAAAVPSLSSMEVNCYLETNQWNYKAALAEAQQDYAWEQEHAEEIVETKARQEQLWPSSAAAQPDDNDEKESYYTSLFVDHVPERMRMMICVWNVAGFHSN